MKKSQQKQPNNSPQPIQHIDELSLEQLRQKNQWNTKRGNIKTKDKLKLKLMKYKQQFNELSKHCFVGMINHTNTSLNLGYSQKCQQYTPVKKTNQVSKFRSQQEEQSGYHLNLTELNDEYGENNDQSVQVNNDKYRILPPVSEDSRQRSQTEPIGNLVHSQRKYNNSFVHNAYRDFKTEHRKYKKLSQLQARVGEPNIKINFRVPSKNSHHHSHSHSTDFDTFNKKCNIKSEHRYSSDREDSYDMRKKQRSYNSTEIGHIHYNNKNRIQHKREQLNNSDRQSGDWTGKIVKNRAYLVNKLGGNISKLTPTDPDKPKQQILQDKPQQTTIQNRKKNKKKNNTHNNTHHIHNNSQQQHQICFQYQMADADIITDAKYPSTLKLEKRMEQQSIVQPLNTMNNGQCSLGQVNWEKKQSYQTSKFGEDYPIIQLPQPTSKQLTSKQYPTSKQQPYPTICQPAAQQQQHKHPIQIHTQQQQQHQQHKQQQQPNSNLLTPSTQHNTKPQQQQGELQVQQTHYLVVQTIQKLKSMHSIV